jgi:hypothetical protein
LWRRDAHGSSLVASDPRQMEGIMRAAIVACFLAFGAVGCASTREPETDAAADEIQRRTMPEHIRLFVMGQQPYCPYRVVGEIDAGRGMNHRDELQRRAFALRADAVIMLADDGTGPVMGVAIVYTDPDCRY